MINSCSILLTYNNLSLTKTCISSLRENTIFDSDNILTIIDNYSTDGTREYLLNLDLDYVDVILNKRKVGLPSAYNQGIKRIDAKYYLLLQNDIQVFPHWRDILITYSNLDSTIGIIGLDTKKIIKGRDKAPDNTDIFDVPLIGTVCTLIKKEVIDSIGYFDEAFDYHDYDDTEYCLRARLHGWRTVWYLKQFIRHEERATNIGVKSGKNLYLNKKKEYSMNSTSLILDKLVKGKYDTSDCLYNLYHLAKKANIIVELGVREGISTRALLLGAKEGGGTVYSIDIDPCERAKRFIKNLKLNNWVFIQGNDLDIVKSWNKEIDLLFIDTVHDYNHVLNELIEFSKFIEKGNILVHDSLVPSYGVKDAIKEFITKYPKWEYIELGTKYGLGLLRKKE